jgi:hypothetical protein
MIASQKSLYSKANSKPTFKPTPSFSVNPTSDHIDKWQASVDAVQIQNFKDIPLECDSNFYDVALISFVDQGSHFFLTSTLSRPNGETE